MSKSLIHVTADMVIHNPNPFTLDLASADLTAYVDEIALADIDQSYDTSMPASGNFNMPVTIKFDLDKLYNEAPLAAIGKGLQILSKRQLKVKFLGNIKAGKGAAKVTVNIDQIEDVKF
jgi:LEA14-like dessication related protein